MQPAAPPTAPLTHQNAARWLRRVGGRAFRNREAPDGPQGWVALAVIPPVRNRSARVILAMGPSLADATVAVRSKWDALWDEAAPHVD